MLTMRQQFGDGAVTAATMLGVLVDGLHALLERGEEPDTLNARLSVQVTQLTRELRRADGEAGQPSPKTYVPPYGPRSEKTNRKKS